MLVILFALFLLGGCSQWSVHDTIDSLPMGVYTIDRSSFADAPACVKRVLERMLKDRQLLPKKLKSSQHLARYKIYVHYTTLESKSIMHILADNTHSRTNDALITVTRTRQPSESEEQHVRHMVSALDKKFPTLSGTGVGICTFIYGEESRPTWNRVTKRSH